MRHIGFEPSVSVSSEERCSPYDLLYLVSEGSFDSFAVRPYVQTYLGAVGFELLPIPIEQVRDLHLRVGIFVVLLIHHRRRDAAR
jgi:hypothetical protein